MGAFNVDITTLYNAIVTVKSVREEANELLEAMRSITIEVKNSIIIDKMAQAKANVADIYLNKAGTIQKKLDNLKNTLCEMDSSTELLFLSLSNDFSDDFGNILDDFDEYTDEQKQELLYALLSRAGQQNETFELVEEYEAVLAEYTAVLKKYGDKIAELEEAKAKELSEYTGNVYDTEAYDKWMAEVVEKYDKQIKAVQGEYDTLAEALSLLTTAKDLAEDYAFGLYKEEPGFKGKTEDGMQNQIASHEFVYNESSYAAGDGYYIFYDKDGNVIENISQTEKELYLNRYDHMFEYLDENEKQIAAYLLNTGNIEKLDQYLDLKGNHAAQREGKEKADKVLEKIKEIEESSPNEGIAREKILGLLAAEGFVGGLENFSDGLLNLSAADGKMSDSDYKVSYITQFLQGKYKDEEIMKMLTTGTFEISTSLGNMAPSMVIGIMTGNPFVGSALMGASSAGNSREQALQQGMSEEQAWVYGVLTGASETVLGTFLGAIPGLSQMEKFTKLPGWQGFIAKLGSEGLEESTQVIVEALTSKLVTKERLEINWGEVAKSGIYGMITAGITNGGGMVINGTTYMLTELSTSDIKNLTQKYESADMTNPNVMNELVNDLKEHSKENVPNNVATNTESSKSAGLSLFNTSNTKASEIVSSKTQPTDQNQNQTNNTTTNTNNTQKTNPTERNWAGEIGKINYETARGHFYTIKVNSLSEIPSDLWSQIDDPSLVKFDVNGKKVSFANARMNESNMPSWKEALQREQEAYKNKFQKPNTATATQSEIIQITDINDINSEFISSIKNTDSTKFQLPDGQVVSLKEVYDIFNNNIKELSKDPISRTGQPSEIPSLKSLVQKLGINEALKAIWHVTYGNDYSYVPVELKTDIANLSTADYELFLDYYNQASKANSNSQQNNEQINLEQDESLVDSSIYTTESVPRNVEYLNDLDNVKANKSLYLEDRNTLARELNISKEEAQSILDKKIKEIIQDSEVAIRADSKSILNILKNGKIKNLFETGTGKGSTDINHRAGGEDYLYGISEDTNIKDRPIYGLAMPKLDTTNSDVLEFYRNQGSHYGDVIIMLNKDKIANNSTFTCGDSLEYNQQVAVSDYSNPTYNGSPFRHIFSNIDFSNPSNFQEQWSNVSLLNTFRDNAKSYLEVQVHGEANHTTDIIDKIIFPQEPSWQIKRQLDKAGINWEVLPTEPTYNQSELTNEIASIKENTKDLFNASTATTMLNLKKTLLGFLTALPSTVNKFRSDNLSSNSLLFNQCLEEGLYHITSESAAQKILETGYVKASGNPVTSYGSKKAFFFSGVPGFGEVCSNVNFLEKTTAIKIKPTAEQLNSNNFKYRSHDDFAISHNGDFYFNNQNAELVYLGLAVNDNGEFYYKEISKDEYENYVPNTDSITRNSPKIVKNLANDLKTMLFGLAYQYDTLAGNVNKLNQLATGSPLTELPRTFDPVHGFQITESEVREYYGFAKEDFINNMLNGINNKGYMSNETGNFIKDLFDGSSDVYIKTIHSNDLASIFDNGIGCFGNTASGMNAVKTIDDINLEDTVLEMPAFVEAINRVKSLASNRFSQAGNPIDGMIAIKIPKGSSINDIVSYNESMGVYTINPEFIQGYIPVSTDGIVGDVIPPSESIISNAINDMSSENIVSVNKQTLEKNNSNNQQDNEQINLEQVESTSSVSNLRESTILDFGKNINKRPFVSEFITSKDEFAGSQHSLYQKTKKSLKTASDKIELTNLEKTFRQYYPNATKQEMYNFFKRIEETGCTYVAMASCIFEQLNYDPNIFYKNFGFDMYLPNGQLNHDQLILDYFAYLSKTTSVTYTKPTIKNFDSWTVAAKELFGEELTTQEALIKITTNAAKNNWQTSPSPDGSVAIEIYDGTHNEIIGTPSEILRELLGMDLEINNDKELLEILQKNGFKPNLKTYDDGCKTFAGINSSKFTNAYFKSKNIDFITDISRIESNELEVLYNELNKAYDNGFSIEVSARSYHRVSMTDGHKFGWYTFSGDREGHAMIFRGITPNGDFIVSSWGKHYCIPKEFANGLDFNIVEIKQK